MRADANIRWLAYPEIQPAKFPAKYLVTLKDGHGNKTVSVLPWERDHGKYLGGYLFKKPPQIGRNIEVIAWANFPEPA